MMDIEVLADRVMEAPPESALRILTDLTRWDVQMVCLELARRAGGIKDVDPVMNVGDTIVVVRANECKHGHELVPGNLVKNGRDKLGNQRWACKECARRYNRRKKRARKLDNDKNSA